MDDTIPPLARILYGEIVVLSNQTGYCFASNNYLCDINKVDPRTIRRLLRILELKGYIKIIVDLKQKNSKKRKIYIN